MHLRTCNGSHTLSDVRAGVETVAWAQHGKPRKGRLRFRKISLVFISPKGARRHGEIEATVELARTCPLPLTRCSVLPTASFTPILHHLLCYQFTS